jgi:serine/threonine protein kinase
MSPEQVRGTPADKRADIWAFGCVLYDMLKGRRSFGGETSSDAIAAILERQREWKALPDNTPPAIVRLLRRSLDEDRRQRQRDIGDARLEVNEVLAGTSLAPVVRQNPCGDVLRYYRRQNGFAGILGGR